MPLRIRSKETTPLGTIISMLVAGVLAVAAFRATWWLSSNFALAWWAAVSAFVGALIAGQLLISVREYTFDATSQALTVRERWLGFIRRRPRSIRFADIAAIFLRSQESVYVVVVLRSGEKLYPRWPGKVREINRYCAAVKRVTHTGRISATERAARGRRARSSSIVSLTAHVREVVRETRTGICPRCGAAVGANGRTCPACGLRLS